MDLTNILLALGAFAIGLCMGGCISIGVLLVVVCILYCTYYVVNAMMNIGNAIVTGLQDLKEPEPEEEERHIGFQSNLIDTENKD